MYVKVELTWDETDPNRGKAMKRAFEVFTIHRHSFDEIKFIILYCVLDWWQNTDIDEHCVPRLKEMRWKRLQET